MGAWGGAHARCGSRFTTPCSWAQVLDLSDPLLSSRDDDATTHLARALRVNRSLSTLRVAKHRFFDFAAASEYLFGLFGTYVP